MKIVYLLVISIIGSSCVSVLFDEQSLSYYQRRVNKSYEEIFEGTEVKQLQWQVFTDDGEGLRKEILDKKIDFETPGYQGINLLNWAIGANRNKAVRALLELGADPNHFNDVRVGNLSLAVANRNESAIRALAEFGSNMHEEPNLAILEDAISTHGPEYIPLLIELGSDPDYFEVVGNPLVSSVGTTGMRAILLLLDLGASPITTPAEEEYFRRQYVRRPFGYPDNPPSGLYTSDLYGELYQRMIEFGVAEPNEAHNEWLVSQGREPNPLE
jgi:ankyrin repeat protein